MSDPVLELREAYRRSARPRRTRPNGMNVV
jgi:hypothetical protein